MPDMSGFAVTKIIRNDNSKNLQTPIVALTIHTDNEYKDRCREAGVNDFIEKPLTSYFAQEILEHWLERVGHGNE
jgi:CheY-like chemotaxis protein